MPSTGPLFDPRAGGLSLQLDGGGLATVHGLDPAGMDIETDAPLALGQWLDFELRQAGSRVKFAASGMVVAVRLHGRARSVHIRFHTLHLRAA